MSATQTFALNLILVLLSCELQNAHTVDAPPACCFFIIYSLQHNMYRFGHGSDFSKLASSNHDEQTDYVVGVSLRIAHIMSETVKHSVALVLTPFHIVYLPAIILQCNLGTYIQHIQYDTTKDIGGILLSNIHFHLFVTCNTNM